MKKVLRILACLTLLAYTASSCKEPHNASDLDLFSSRKDICVVVGRKDMIDFAGKEIQTSFNQSKHLYRAGLPKVQLDSTSGKMVETVEEYYILALESIPNAEGATVSGSLHLKASTLSAGFRTYAVNMEVVKQEGSLAWLWDPSQKVGVIARVSE